MEALNDCSSWETAKNRVKHLLHLRDKLLKKSATSSSLHKEASASIDESQTLPLEEEETASQLFKAQMLSLAHLQIHAFPEEFQFLLDRALHEDQTFAQIQNKLKTNVPELAQLCPFYDKDLGVLRVGGRLKNAELSIMERHPIILPKGKHITGLIIDFYHRKTHHQGYGVTLNAV